MWQFLRLKYNLPVQLASEPLGPTFSQFGLDRLFPTCSRQSNRPKAVSEYSSVIEDWTNRGELRRTANSLRFDTPERRIGTQKNDFRRARLRGI